MALEITEPMAPTIEVDLEQEEIVLNSVAQAEKAASSKLSSYEALPLTELDDRSHPHDCHISGLLQGRRL